MDDNLEKRDRVEPANTAIPANWQDAKWHSLRFGFLAGDWFTFYQVSPAHLIQMPTRHSTGLTMIV
jgi:hypothetical protein